MPLPQLPIFFDYDTEQAQTDRLRNYHTRFRGELEGQEAGIPTLVEQGQIWGAVPPSTGNLIIDPSFELNRGAWYVPTGARIFEDVTFARSGNYVMRTDANFGYAGGGVYPNLGIPTPIVPATPVLWGGWVIGTGAAIGTAFMTIEWLDGDKAVIGSPIDGAGVTIGGAYSFVFVKAIAPALTSYVRFSFRATGLTGSEAAGWDDMEAFVIHAQGETRSDTGLVNYVNTNEIVISGPVTMGPLIQTAGASDILTPVIIHAKCTFKAFLTTAGDNLTFRIRRGTTIAGTLLDTAPTLKGDNGQYASFTFDTSPNVPGESWVLTGQALTNTGALSSEHRMWVTQGYR